jgi:hypothetical protein
LFGEPSRVRLGGASAPERTLPRSGGGPEGVRAAALADDRIIPPSQRKKWDRPGPTLFYLFRELSSATYEPELREVGGLRTRLFVPPDSRARHDVSNPSALADPIRSPEGPHLRKPATRLRAVSRRRDERRAQSPCAHRPDRLQDPCIVAFPRPERRTPEFGPLFEMLVQ